MNQKNPPQRPFEAPHVETPSEHSSKKSIHPDPDLCAFNESPHQQETCEVKGSHPKVDSAEEKGTLENGRPAPIETPLGTEQPASTDQLTAEEAAYQAEVADLKDKLMRTLADAENLRKRSVREKEETARFAIQQFALDLLQVSDNLERALSEFQKKEALHHPPETQVLLEGIQLTGKELGKVFTRHGLVQISPLGEKFDHNFHEAMMEIESSNEVSGTVVQVFESGYTLNGRLLRPARVGVAK